MKGSIFERKGKRGTTYLLKWDEGRDLSGRRIQRYKTVRGSREAAELELEALVREANSRRPNVLDSAAVFKLAMIQCPDLLFSLTMRYKLDEAPKRSNKRGVYCLYYLSEIVYIGKSKNIIDRIRTHQRKKIFDFDEWSFVLSESEKQQAFLESTLIINFKPRYNSILNLSDFRNGEIE